MRVGYYSIKVHKVFLIHNYAGIYGVNVVLADMYRYMAVGPAHYLNVI